MAPYLLCILWLTPIFLLRLSVCEEILLPTPFICDKKATPDALSAVKCVQDCHLTKLMGDPVNITFFQPESRAKLIIASCMKLTITQTFTKTWLFSTISSSPSFKHGNPSITECEQEWDKACSKGLCSSTIPPVEPEYLYASDNTVERTGITIDARELEADLYIKGERYIMINGAEVLFSDGKMWDQEKETWYIWDKNKPVACSLKPTATTQCLITEGDEMICDSLGVAFNSSKRRSVSSCGQEMNGALQYVPEGYLFAVGDYGGKLSMPGYPIVKTMHSEVVEELVTNIQLAYSKERSEQCSQSCFRIPRGPLVGSTWVGNRLISNTTGSLMVCRFNPFCKLTVPMRICVTSGLLQIHCGHETEWWDLTSLEVRPGIHCPRSETPSNAVKYRSGNVLYSINSSGIYIEQNDVPETYTLFLPSSGIISVEVESMKTHFDREAMNFKPWGEVSRSKRVASSKGILDILSGIVEKIGSALSSFYNIVIYVPALILGVAIVFPYLRRPIRNNNQYRSVFDA